MKNFKIYLKENYVNSTMLIILSLSTAVLSYYSSKIMNVIFRDGENLSQNMTMNLIAFIAIYLMLFFISLATNIYGNIGNYKGGRNYMSFILHKIFNGDYKYFQGKHQSSIIADMGMISNNLTFFYNAIIRAISKIIEFIVYFIVIFNISKISAIGTILIGCVFYIASKLVNKNITTHSLKFREENRTLYTNIIESLSNIKNIKAKSSEDYFTEKIYEQSKKANSHMIKFNFYHQIWESIGFVFSTIAPITIIYLMLYMTGVNSFRNEEIMIIYLFVPLLLNAINNLFNILIEFYKAKPYISKMDEFHEMERERSGNIIVENFESLECNSVSVCFKERRIYIPNMFINKGEKVILKGESGIGKSTLFNIILGLVKDYDGTIKINGVDLKNINIDSLRKVIGISFQNSGVYSMTLKENISLSEKKDLSNIIEKMELSKVMENKKEMILGKDILSGGEKARICLAQNLVREPKLILIDETTSGLTIDMEKSILCKILTEYSEETLICITHRHENKDMFTKVIDFNGEEMYEAI